MAWMLKHLRHTLPFGLLLPLLIAVTPALLAQETCPALVQRALTAIGDNCGNMARNSACYGYNLVGATFTEAVPEDFFTTPADRTEINQLETLTTAALDVEADRWGVAVMTLQANIPNTLPGQAVTFVLLGDVEVENAVEPDAAFTPVDPITVTARVVSNIRSGPSTATNVIGAVDIGAVLEADGMNADRNWVRVVYDGLIGWIRADLIGQDTDLSALPVITTTTRSPMQAFYLRTGIGQPACSEAPADSLVVQGPNRLTVDFTVNGANVSLSSTAVFRILPGNLMEMTVLAGSASIDGVNVRQGFKTTLCLSEPDDRGVDGQANDQIVTCPPSTPQRLSNDEQRAWCALGDIPATPLNYTIPINCEQGIVFPTPVPTAVPTRVVGGPDATPVISGDCGGLRPTSPLTDAPSSPTIFYWDGVASATDYNLVFYDLAGNVTRTQFSGGAGLNTGVSGLVEGTQFRWAVEAYVSGTLLCTSLPTGPIIVVGPQVSDDDDDMFTLTASWGCGPVTNEITVTWGGVPADAFLLLHYDDSYPSGGPYIIELGPGPGSLVFAFFWPGDFNGYVEWPDGNQVATLPTIICPN